jgi:hypothetical protein
MRSLAQTSVLAKAGGAAVITSLAAYPRLASWTERTGPVGSLLVMLLWTTFVLWSFVFGWHEQYTGKKFFSLNVPLKSWALVTLIGVGAAIFLMLVADPQLRLTTPKDYPTSLRSWIDMGLFTLALTPLFLCFAPFAFFMRLFRKPQVATVFTVLFGVFILYLKLSSSSILPPLWLVAVLALVRVAGGFLTVYVYLQGGAILVFWMGILIELRHLIPLLKAH